MSIFGKMKTSLRFIFPKILKKIYICRQSIWPDFFALVAR